MKLVDLKTQALRHVALGEYERAFLLYRSIIQQLPADLDARMKVADLLVHLDQGELACRVYAAIAWCDLQAGRPLHAIVCGQALLDLGQSASSIHDTLVLLYGAGSERLSRSPGASGRPPSLDPEQPLQPVDLQPLPENLAAESAAEVASDTESFTAFPRLFDPVPLLSDLAPEALHQILSAVQVRRVGPRSSLFKEGSPSYALFYVASGAVEAFREGPPRQVLLRLSEGSLLGEKSLIDPRPRAVSAETCEAADLIELPVRALRAAADLPGVSAALADLVRDRLLRQLLGRSPLFLCLSTGQRLDLLRRFQCQDLVGDSFLLREEEAWPGLFVLLSGQLEAIRGSEPFETVLEPFRAGDVLGELGLCRSQPASASLRVPASAQVALLHREAFEKTKNTVPAMQQHLAALPQETLRDLGPLGRSLLYRPGAPIFLEEEDEMRNEFPLLT